MAVPRPGRYENYLECHGCIHEMIMLWIRAMKNEVQSHQAFTTRIRRKEGVRRREECFDMLVIDRSRSPQRRERVSQGCGKPD